MKKDPHADEPQVQLDEATYQAYLKAVSNADAWKREAERLKALLNEQLGDAYAGVVNDEKVITHRPTLTFRVSALLKDYPEITQHYIVTTVERKLDMDAFRKVHPDIAEQYQSRSFRLVGSPEE